jgi:hypothetical protein
MLADGGAQEPSMSRLRVGLHVPATQFSKLIAFIAQLLPHWRDDPQRPAETAENKLSEQLCDFLDDEVRTTAGFEIFKFQREPHDDVRGSRNLDIAAKPSGTSIWIEDRHYKRYDIFLPIECKRLPTPKGKDRDPREYLFSSSSTTGGVQRFKSGDHGANHSVAAMIGYVQANGIQHWQAQVRTWIDELVGSSTPLWNSEDHFTLVTHDILSRSAILRSYHARNGDLASIDMSHLWIEM